MTGAFAHIAVAEYDLLQLLDVLAEHRSQPFAHFKAVEFDGIVAAGDHDTAVGFQMDNGEIERRGGALTDLDHIQAGGENAVDIYFTEMRRREAHVVADRNGLMAAATHPCAIGTPKVVHHIVGEIGLDNTADVVFTKNALVHWRLLILADDG